MNSGEAALGAVAPPGGTTRDRPWSGRLRVTARGVQIALGVVWLLDGLFQFKGFMYTQGIVKEVFGPAALHQPSWVADPMRTFDHFYGHDLTLWNTLAGEIQVAIGLGLILSRKTVKPALLVSFVWALVVWWFGEGFGGLVSNTLPAQLMGEPGAVILYGLIGLLVWPAARGATDEPTHPAGQARSPAGTGPLGDRGGLAVWSLLWLLGAGLWLVNVNRAKDAASEMIKSMAEASPHWLAKIQDWAVRHSSGHGTTIAIVLAIVSVAVAVGVWWMPLRWPALTVGIVLSLAYWLFGQSLGGPFWVESATDVNSGPLFVLLAVALFPVLQAATAAGDEGAVGASVAAAGAPGAPA